MEREESVSDCAHGGVVVKATPRSALEVIEADFLFHLLVVALDSPAQLCQPHQLLDAHVRRKV
jgi:hypothetical protein